MKSEKRKTDSNFVDMFLGACGFALYIGLIVTFPYIWLNAYLVSFLSNDTVRGFKSILDSSDSFQIALSAAFLSSFIIFSSKYFLDSNRIKKFLIKNFSSESDFLELIIAVLVSTLIAFLSSPLIFLVFWLLSFFQ